ncbi:hypothetical protein HZC34_03755 [Candidatus Saganbacteria bacterium]|nr:hypothetical protein [Candidatus Saganbacteria bacterium]
MKKIILSFFVAVSLCLFVAMALCSISFALDLPSDSGSSLLNTVSQVSNLSTAATTKPSYKLGGISIAYVKVGADSVGVLTWHPDLKFGPWGAGLDVNMSLGDKYVTGYEGIVVRYAEYDDSSRGLRYGILDGITWGHGLLLKNYTTKIIGPVIVSDNQLGFKGYYSFDKFTVRGLTTHTNIIGARVEEKINPMLTLGQHYVADNGGTNGRPAIAGLGADASVPLPLNFEAYAEAAQIVNHGSGIGAGLTWAYDIMAAKASFNAQYRTFDKGFIPSLFSSDYETNPKSLASAEASGNSKNGYLVELGIDALGLAQLNAAFESYVGSNQSFGATLAAKVSEQVSFTGYYKQPSFINFSSLSYEQGAIMGGKLAYKVNPYTTLITNFKRAYNPATGQVQSDQYYEMQFNL